MHFFPSTVRFGALLLISSTLGRCLPELHLLSPAPLDLRYHHCQRLDSRRNFCLWYWELTFSSNVLKFGVSPTYLKWVVWVGYPRSTNYTENAVANYFPWVPRKTSNFTKYRIFPWTSIASTQEFRFRELPRVEAKVYFSLIDHQSLLHPLQSNMCLGLCFCQTKSKHRNTVPTTTQHHYLTATSSHTKAPQQLSGPPKEVLLTFHLSFKRKLWS